MSPITPRDTLKLAAAAADDRSVAPTVTPAEAAHRLDAPLDPGQLPVRQAPGRRGDVDIYDPASYATELDGLDRPALVAHIAPEQLARYRQARAAMLRAVPMLADLPVNHPWVHMDEAAMGVWVDAWIAGVRAGAAYEHLRLAMLGPIRVCRACEGFGIVGNGVPDAHTGTYTPCSACGEAGTLATPAPTG